MRIQNAVDLTQDATGEAKHKLSVFNRQLNLCKRAYVPCAKPVNLDRLSEASQSPDCQKRPAKDGWLDGLSSLPVLPKRFATLSKL